ncbi:MAG TPA: CRTAC1 family protein [Vicinamibacterales bacterium]|nr:CRTAC1 family protein [Vicinamibacterales bacterium]
MRRRVLVATVIAVVLLVAAAIWIDRRGLAFYESGRAIVQTLTPFAAAIAANDADAIARFYSAEYAGTRLGLSTRVLAGEKDGVRHYRQRSDNAPADRAAAVAEWRQYRASFSAIEEVALHIDDRVEQWGGSSLVATVRFEAIGTPRGEPRSGIDRARFRLTFDRTPEGLRIRSASLLEGDRLIAARPQFEDVARAAGVDFVNQYYPPFLNEPMRFGMIRYGPGGISAADVDNDGFYDLFIPDGVESRLLRNRADGTFEDVTARAGLSGLDGVSVGVFADYDNDGHKDLFVSRTFSPNQLFHNDGDGTFTDVTAGSGLGADCCTTVASWGDYDNDGDLDLYVGRYLDPRTKIPTTFYARNGEPNQLYRNEGGGKFTNVTEQAGVGEVGLCLGSVFGDIDEDGYVDLYVVNDFGRKTLYRNNRDGTFADITVRSGTLNYGAGMSASMGDYDNDGLLDLYVANIRSEHAWFADPPTVWRYMLNVWRQGVWWTDMPLYLQILRQSGFQFPHVFRQMASGNALLRNRGDGTFDDVTWAAAANPHGWFWGSSFADFDNDGWLDIYSANGWVYNDRGTEIELEFLNNVVSAQKEYKTGKFFDPKFFGRRSWHGYERNRHLRANGDGTFIEAGHALGTDLIMNSRGIAVADFWNRGVLDIAVAASTDRHALLKNNLEGTRHWLAVELVGTSSNRDAVGARVHARIGPMRQMREVALGDGYGSQNTLRQYFGLGDRASVDELLVKWPKSGTTQRFRNVAADRIIEITEGRDSLVEKRYPAGGSGS